MPSAAFKVAARCNELWAGLTDQAVIFTRDKLAEMEQEAWVCGNRRLRQQLDWEPDWPLEEGARQTVEWYQNNDWI